MVKCVECDKKLGLLKGYRHPTMGKDHPICGSCFDKIDASVQEWGQFIMNSEFKEDPTKQPAIQAES